MDVAASNVPVRIESVVETSMVDGNGGDSPAKKQRFGDEINRLAEIVLVLSALGRMRGGDSPTELEVNLMVEARSKLAGMCQDFTPKDIIGREDVRAVIEDLGLNGKLNDQRLGLRAPKLTISDKVSLGKRKMEEAKKYPTPTISTGNASHLSQLNGSVASPALAKNVPVAHQWPSSGVTTIKTTGSHVRMERPHVMLSGASQGTAISSANYYAAPWSAQQPQSAISFSTAPDKTVPIQSSVRVPDSSFSPFMSQTQHGTFPGTNQPIQEMHYGHTSSSGNNHSQIAKIIHKVLQPKVTQYPLWDPPSREYMSRAVTCQMCEVTIGEVETLLICDTCEKAYHLQCLKANNTNGVPKSEWHCSRCVQAFNGKPFPPKYGRAITNATAKIPFGTAGVKSSTVKKVGSVDIKVNQQKPIVTTTPRVQNSPEVVSGTATTSHFKTASVSANTSASAAKTTNIGSRSFRESLICATNSSAPVSLTETPNPTAIVSTNALTNSGLVSKPLAPVGTISSTSPVPFGNQVLVNATSNAIPSTPMNVSLVAQALTATENGDSSSIVSGTADNSNNSKLNTDLTNQVHALNGTSTSDSQPAMSTEDPAIGQALKAHDGPQAPMQNVARSEDPSESTSHSDSLNAKTTPEKSQELSKDAMEIPVSEICHHPTESPITVISDKDSKISAESSTPQEN